MAELHGRVNRLQLRERYCVLSMFKVLGFKKQNTANVEQRLVINILPSTNVC